MRVGELINKRTATSKHFIRDDGKYEAEIYARPVHYQNVKGMWQDIDLTSVNDSSVPGFEAAFNKIQVPVRFARTSKQPWRVEFPGGHWITYRAQGGLPAQAVMAGNVVTYADAWQDTNLRYTVLGHGIKEEIILKAATAPGSFTFAVQTSPGVTLEADGQGGYLLQVDGNTIGRIPAPYAEDAAGQRGSVTLAYDGGSVTLTPNMDWLATAAYPVSVDPSTTIQPDGTAGKDSYVQSDAPANNYGSSTQLLMGTYNVTTDNYRALIQFDLSTIYGPITAALLGVYCTINPANNANMTAHQITATWAENTVTYGTLPAFSGSAEDTVLIDDVSRFYELDISSLAEDWRSGAANNYGVLLKIDESVGNSNKVFASSDHATAAWRPKLTVTYTTTVTITAPASVDSGNPTQYTDEVSPAITWTTDFTQNSYQVQIWDSGDSVVIDTGEVAGAGTSYAPAASAGLVYGEVYQVKIRGKDDNSLWSDWFAGHYLQCIYSAPANLVATADAVGAEIDLTWDAHTGENLAGYRVYRKLTTEATYTQISTGIVVSAGYDDEQAVSGTTYDYVVTAVATDGYESADSSSAQASVTISGFWIDDTEVKLRVPVAFEYPRRASRRVATDDTYVIQDLGTLPRIAQFTLAFESITDRAALVALFPAGHEFSYRDRDGVTFRGKVTGSIAESRMNLPGKYYGNLTFEATETSAS